MSLIFATQLTAVATAVLAVFAFVTAWYARRAFLKQSQEVSDQAEMLKVQSEQLTEQRKLNKEQTRVLALQAEELHKSLAEREREAEQRRRAQAGRVFVSQQSYISSYISVDPEPIEVDSRGEVIPDEPDCTRVEVAVINSSDQPIYEAELLWRYGSASRCAIPELRG